MNSSLQECFLYILHIKGFLFLFMIVENHIGHGLVFCLILLCGCLVTSGYSVNLFICSICRETVNLYSLLRIFMFIPDQILLAFGDKQ